VTFNPTIHVVRTMADAGDFLDWMSQPRRRLALDVETEGLRPSVHRIRLVQVGTVHESWVLVADDWWGLFREAVRRHGNRRWVGHNLVGFDMRMLAKRGIHLPIHQVDDTLIAANLLDNAARNGLKALAARVVDPKAAAASDDLKRVYKEEGYDWATIPVDHPLYQRYSGMDTSLTDPVADAVLPLIEERGMTKLYHRELLAADILSKAADRGLPVDEGAAQAAIAEVRQRLVPLTERLAEMGVDNPSAPRQVAAALEAEGIKLTKRTKTGDPSTAKDVLEALAGKGSKVATTVLEWRQQERLVTNYLEPMCGEFLDADGRVRYGVRSFGAMTGRVSVESPPLHQLPKQDKTVRRVVKAPKGQTVIAADYDQVEPRIMAHFTQEEAWLTAIRNGVSFHKVNAAAIYGPDYTPEQYQPAKNTGMAMLYCGGVKKLAATAGVSLSEMQAIKDRFFQEFPKAKQFIRRVIRTGERRVLEDGEPWVKLPSGRRVACDPGYEYRLLACLGQGTGADILKDSLVRMDHEGLTDHLIITVHDEVVLLADTDIAVDVARATVEAMTDTDTFRVPITASASVGTTWGDMEELTCSS
jgi:DNA polymerase-1